MSIIDQVRKMSPAIPPRDAARMLGCSPDYVRAARYRIRHGYPSSRKAPWRKAGFATENDWRRHLINQGKK